MGLFEIESRGDWGPGKNSKNPNRRLELPGRPGKNQKEGLKDQGTLNALEVVPPYENLTRAPPEPTRISPEPYQSLTKCL